MIEDVYSALLKSQRPIDRGDDILDRIHDVIVVSLRTTLRDTNTLPHFASVVAHRQRCRAIRHKIRWRECALDPLTEDNGPSPEVAAQLAEKRVNVRLALEGLRPTRYREILTRAYLLEQDEDEVCEGMGLRPSQYRLMKSRAKSALARRIEGFAAAFG